MSPAIVKRIKIKASAVGEVKLLFKKSPNVRWVRIVLFYKVGASVKSLGNPALITGSLVPKSCEALA